MRLTTKGHVAVAAMIDVALYGTTKPVNLASLSLRQHVSLSYLETLFTRLRQHKLVQSTRGPGGGYSLGRDAGAITVADVVFAVDDSLSRQVEHVASGDSRISTPELWASLGHRMVEFLDSVTLQALVADQLAKGVLAAAEPVRRAPMPTARAKSPLPRGPNSVFALGKTLAAS